MPNTFRGMEKGALLCTLLSLFDWLFGCESFWKPGLSLCIGVNRVCIFYSEVGVEAFPDPVQKHPLLTRYKSTLSMETVLQSTSSPPRAQNQTEGCMTSAGTAHLQGAS